MFTVSLYTIALVFHVAAGCVLIGLVMIAPLVRRSIRGADTTDAIRPWLDFNRRAGGIAHPSALVLLGTGVYLGSAGWWYQPWFYVAAAAWLINSMLATRVLRPCAQRLQAALPERSGAISSTVEALRRAKRWDVALQIARANDFAMLYVMFEKPGLVECLILLVAASLLSIAVGAWQTADRPRPAIA